MTEEVSDLYLYSYLFHYNSYTKTWACFDRDDYRSYWNGKKCLHKVGRGQTIEDALRDARDGKDEG